MKVYPIRHHGPGSAKRLLRALKAQEPDCVLVEAPADTEAALEWIGHAKMKPPVALLAYDPKDLSRASWLPFAHFSPEWQAIKFALKKQIPIRAMDLPCGIQFNFEQDEQSKLEFANPDPELLTLQYDPLYVLAQLAGYSDSERWWEAAFEQEMEDTTVFEALLDMMKALREEVGRVETPETLIREAFMRKSIRKAQKDGFQNIAVVCGAWHAPVLADLAAYSNKADSERLRGRKKSSVKTTWAPWSYERLAFQSGYGAGVISPAWYELLFDQREELTIQWMIRLGRLLRSEDLDASVAHVQEAVRLADTLATMRGRRYSGIEELEDAALAIFTKGNSTQLDLIHNRLIIGTKLGKVPSEIPAPPLQRSIEKAIRSVHLYKEYNSGERSTKVLDLRKPANLAASHLLHRLQLLGIPWGTPMKVSKEAKGSFSEKWKLYWKAEFTIRIIEAGMLGNTLEEAVVAKVEKLINEGMSLSSLLQLLDNLLKADIPGPLVNLMEALGSRAAQSIDTLELMQALPPLIRILRYGDTRKSNQAGVKALLPELLPRVAIGLPLASTGIQDEPARLIFQEILNVQGALSALDEDWSKAAWLECLVRMHQNPEVHRLLAGLATRLCFDQNALNSNVLEKYFSLELSGIETAGDSAQWLEGFLYGSGLLLLHQMELRTLLQDWVEQLPASYFEKVLPVLRRTFARFSQAERGQLFALAQKNQPKEMEPDIPINAQRAKQAMDSLLKLLQ